MICEFEEDRSGLLALAASGLATGALAGFVGSAFHFALAAAERSRNSLLDWARGYPSDSWLAPDCPRMLCALAYRNARRFRIA